MYPIAMKTRHCSLFAFLLLAWPGWAQTFFVEAESFEKPGGWKLDTQFIDTVGSPYLLAHGLGQPVADAVTTVKFPQPGKYRVFVRTKDWVARWDAKGKPGRFQVLVDGASAGEFGAEGKVWGWQGSSSEIEVKGASSVLTLRDLTGFDGRCDAIYFTMDADDRPPAEMEAWRRKQLGLGDKPVEEGPFDLVVVGGGYSGMGAALSAARAGCKVALIQNRGVLGGNGSSEVRVWAMGNIRRGKYPRVGEIIEEFADRATKSPGTYEEFGDAQKEQIVRAEPNIALFLHHHARGVEVEDGRIVAVDAFDTRSGAEKRFLGKLFADCTGHGTIGYLAKADHEMEPKGRMGMSNMWRWENADAPQPYPETPWALQLAMKDFPYPRDFHGQWFWESGFDKDPLGDAEGIRDWNLRAVYGAFNAMKNGDGAAKHPNARLTWIAYIGGPRESRRLMGDVVLSQDDIVAKKDFPDGCVPSTWSIDLHYPKKQYAQRYPENPFISYAVHDRRVDRDYGYPVPYRCFYSRNVPNLFMAGRCISVTHQALGTVRVMKTCGMMGEVVGKAASICVKQECDPRGVYASYLEELLSMLELPGKARRATVEDEFVIPADAMERAGPRGPMPGIDPASLPGVVVDDRQAEKVGKWSAGQGLPNYFGFSYLYSGGEDAEARFVSKAEKSGKLELRLAYGSHENRGATVPVTVSVGKSVARQLKLDMRKPAPLQHGMISLGTFEVKAGDEVAVKISARGAGGHAHVDAVQFLPVE